MSIVPNETASSAPGLSGTGNRPDIVARVRVRRHNVVLDTPEPPTASAASVAAPVTKAVPGPALKTSDTPNVDDATTYDVGYKRPPKRTQFQKGQSGNPKGRPKEAKSLNTIVRETLLAKIKIRTANGRKNTTSVQALMMQTLESALKGSQRDRHELLRYYREAVPDEAETIRNHAAPSDSEPDDVDAHDRAILERLRAKIVDELGGEK